MITAIAWNNVWRNRRRSLVIIVATTFGLWGGIYSNAMFWGMTESMVNTAIDSRLGHIQIHNKGYLDNVQAVNYIPGGDSVLARIAARIPDVDCVSGRTIVEGMTASASSTFGGNIVGIDPQKERYITNIEASIIEGRYFNGEIRNQAVIGRKLAQRLNIKLNNKIVVSFQGMDSTITYAACRVVGIYKTGSSRFDESNVFLQQEDLWNLLGTPPVYHEIVMRAPSSRNLDSIYVAVASEFPSLDVRDWKTLAPELALMTDMMGQYTLFILAVILLALLFGITNTMFMAVLERIREIGVLLAIGMKKRRVFLMIVLETIFLSIIGGVFGVLLSVGTILLTQNTGIDLSLFSEGLEDIGMSSMLYPFLPPVTYVQLFFMIIAAAVIAAIFPALRAIHTKPATAIRTY